MNESSETTVHRFYELFRAGKMEEAAKQCIGEGFELVNPLPSPIPFGGRFEGVAGFLQYASGLASEIEILVFSIDELISEDEFVVAVGRERSRVIATGAEYEMEWVHIFRVVQDRVVSIREYNDTAAMRDAYKPQS
ncbi:MAG: ketosteroid isomerase-like protein [Hyphomicrobiaceae bacterium]|jgi:ketosteroid isomerase-like protein